MGAESGNYIFLWGVAIFGPIHRYLSTPCRRLNFEILILSVIYVRFRVHVQRILGTKVLCLEKYSQHHTQNKTHQATNEFYWSKRALSRMVPLLALRH